jgi:hypothetical protein
VRCVRITWNVRQSHLSAASGGAHQAFEAVAFRGAIRCGRQPIEEHCMAAFDFLDLLTLLDVFTWRIVIPTVAGVGAGLGAYFLFGETSSSAAVGGALALAGFCIGLFWELGHKRRT